MFHVRFGPTTRAAPPTELYERLGVPVTADTDAIKKAYRRLALQLHPDRHGSSDANKEEQFKRVVEAYDILKDDALRRVYDRQGLEAAKRAAQSGSGSGNAFDDPLADFFAGNGPQFVSLFDILSGAMGGNPNAGAGFFAPQQPRVKRSVRIEQVYQKEPLTLDLPPAVAGDNSAPQRPQIRLDSFAVFNGAQGFRNHCLLRVPPDNVLVALTLEKHDTFEPYNELDLLLCCKVTVYEALGGYSTVVRLPDRNKTAVYLSFDGTVIQPGSLFEIKGLGVPPNGSLMVRFEVEFPARATDINANLRRLLREAQNSSSNKAQAAHGSESAQSSDQTSNLRRIDVDDSNRVL